MIFTGSRLAGKTKLQRYCRQIHQRTVGLLATRSFVDALGPIVIKRSSFDAAVGVMPERLKCCIFIAGFPAPAPPPGSRAALSATPVVLRPFKRRRNMRRHHFCRRCIRSPAFSSLLKLWWNMIVRFADALLMSRCGIPPLWNGTVLRRCASGFCCHWIW